MTAWGGKFKGTVEKKTPRALSILFVADGSFVDLNAAQIRSGIVKKWKR